MKHLPREELSPHSVFTAFQKIARGAEAKIWIDDACGDALREYPEILGWS